MNGGIELLVYSGRTNPRAELDAETERELARRVSTLKPLGRAFAPGDGLGYRGLHVVTTTPTLRDLELFAGAVRVRDGEGRTRDLADPGRALERWLLRAVGTRLPAADQPLVDEILRELGG